MVHDVCVCRGGKYKTDPRSVSKCNSHLASFKLVKQSRWIRNDVDLGPRLGCWARSRAWYCEVFFLDWSTRGFETLYVALGGGWGWDRYIFWFIFSFLSLKSLVIVIFLYLPIILFVLNWVWILLAFFVYISNVFFSSLKYIELWPRPFAFILSKKKKSRGKWVSMSSTCDCITTLLRKNSVLLVT